MMAMIWSWAFGDETEADLESIGFDLVFLSGGASAAWSAESTAVDPLNAYTYAGSPTRYSLGCDVNSTIGAGRVTLPSVSHPSPPQGIVTLAYRTTDATVFDATNRLIEIQTGNTGNAAFVRPTGSGSNTLSLYIDNAFRGTSGAVNANNWNYIALVFDLTTATYSASFYVNGVLQGSGTTSIFVTPQGISLIRFQTTQQGSGLGATSLFGQVITYDDPVGDLADAVSPDNFVTRVVPNANGAGTIGSWSPTGAASLYEAVDPPIDNTTYAGITAPTPLDRLEVQTASATDLQNLLGINPSSIKGATVHSVSLGTATTAKVGIQEGGSETLSAAQPVLTSDTYLVESVANNPSTGTAWVGADQPILVYEIDTV